MLRSVSLLALATLCLATGIFADVTTSTAPETKAPQATGKSKCSSENPCGDGKVCNPKNGKCVELIAFGQKCGGRLGTTCDGAAGHTCKEYDCCGTGKGKVSCKKKFCLCDTKKYIYDAAEPSNCKLVEPKQCNDAPPGFIPPK